MVMARVSRWKYKKGKREAALKAIQEFGDDIPRSNKDFWGGFKGIIVLPASDDPDSALMITLWESEEALGESRQKIFKDAVKDIEKFLDGPPEVWNHILDSLEVIL